MVNPLFSLPEGLIISSTFEEGLMERGLFTFSTWINVHKLYFDQ